MNLSIKGNYAPVLLAEVRQCRVFQLGRKQNHLAFFGLHVVDPVCIEIGGAGILILLGVHARIVKPVQTTARMKV